jgi:predicted DCC family thiol-disulfide oxidoreductase YuxK
MAETAGPVLLYDGLCGFCDRTVRLVLRADRGGVIRFAPLQGAFATGVIERHPELEDVDSLILVENPGLTDERVAVRSDGALRVAEILGGGWRLLTVLALVPRPLRDWAYDVFARWRYRIFGRFEACPIPPADARSRFLD